MRHIFKLMLAAFLAMCPIHALRAQDLAPRAYIITPVHWNAVTLTYSFSDGGILFNNILPVTDAHATLNVPILSYFHSLNFFGRSANITASLPYGVGHFQGVFQDSETKIYRSGLLDSSFRFSVNLKGGPAMSVKEYQSWKQKTILGVSLRVVAPTGQYDSTKLVNNSANRWASNRNLAIPERWGHWVLDGYGGAWFYTTNPEFWSHNSFYPGTRIAIAGAHRLHRGALELRREASVLGLARRQFLVWRSYKLEWRGNSRHLAGKLPHRSDCVSSFEQTPESESQLQLWCLCHLRWQLPKCLRSLAVLVAGETELAFRTEECSFSSSYATDSTRRREHRASRRSNS